MVYNTLFFILSLIIPLMKLKNEVKMDGALMKLTHLGSNGKASCIK